jgi:hypothetical protein
MLAADAPTTILAPSKHSAVISAALWASKELFRHEVWVVPVEVFIEWMGVLPPHVTLDWYRAVNRFHGLPFPEF